MYRDKVEMAARRKFKALEMTTWFRAKRGGKDSTEQKDVPTAFRGKQRRDTERQEAPEEGKEETAGKEVKPCAQVDSGSGNRKANCKTMAVEMVAFIPYNFLFDFNYPSSRFHNSKYV